ncbi:MAG TPA: FKBP-type peptidyl-prolyl cis-trans isomerase [Solirubrobacterales bacterium]|nr:FKBP-type peptidyl-prolyl cis-trans isomerase [Solirubrobacterales bacterium]
MQLLTPLLVVFLLLTPLACGGGGDGGDSTDEEIEALARAYNSGPEIEVPPGPPPKGTVIKDLKIGTGRVAKRGDLVYIHYIGVDWVGDKEFDRVWEPDPPFRRRLGNGNYPEFENAIMGMREGGRREMTVPNYRLPAIIYVVDLEKVKPE